MPTNQMIMDELVSLRGYITTRMDAFDTQSQQIHYEHHMDVDEDSTKLQQKGGACMHTYRGSILKKNQDISSRGDCEEDIAHDLGTVLMKTPISQKEERKKTYEDYRR
ncbi:hypothetical protein Lal_00039709 [Lupinus albus]|nr:hypothetical protein Lal_00039709 [Lupinus albus]